MGPRYSTFLSRERPRGILTESDRKYLRGDSDISRQAIFERRKAIRERVYHGILDLHFLLKYFPDEDREALVEGTHLEQLDLGVANRGGIAFLWTFLPNIMDERAVIEAIDAALKRRGWIAEVDVSIEATNSTRVENSEKAFWGREGGILREPGGLVDRWEEEYEERAEQAEQRSPPPLDEVADMKTRFDELAEDYLSGAGLSPTELEELNSFLPDENKDSAESQQEE